MTLNRKIINVVIYGLSGLVFFLILLGIANLLIPVVDNSFYTTNVQFVNSNLWIIVTLTFLFVTADVFRLLKFPINIPYPIFNAFGGLLLTVMLLKAFSWVLDIIFIDLFSWNYSKGLIYVIVFLLILALGYYNIARTELSGRKRKKRTYKVNNKEN